MPDKPSEQEPSIEEILASIRQIIADDDEEPAKGAAPAPAPTKSDVLDLTEVVRDEPEEDIVVDLMDQEDVVEEEEEYVPPPPLPPPPQPKRPVPIVHEDPEPDSSILTDHAAHAALQGFSRLAQRTPVERQSHLAGITLEDIVRDLMRPMLRDWLDQNLPPLIEKLVAKELQRLARQAQQDE